MQKSLEYTTEAVAKMLKAFDSRPVKDSWRKHRKIEKQKYYQYDNLAIKESCSLAYQI